MKKVLMGISLILIMNVLAFADNKVGCNSAYTGSYDSCDAHEYNFAYFTDFRLANMVAQKSNKPLVLFILDGCIACKKFRVKDISDSKVIEKLKNDFIVVIAGPHDVKKDFINFKGTPSTWFIKDDKLILGPVIGYGQEMINILYKAKKEFKNN